MIIWVFPKIGGVSPQTIHFNRVWNHYKPSILGENPYFWKHPYSNPQAVSNLTDTDSGIIFRFPPSGEDIGQIRDLKTLLPTIMNFCMLEDRFCLAWIVSTFSVAKKLKSSIFRTFTTFHEPLSSSHSVPHGVGITSFNLQDFFRSFLDDPFLFGQAGSGFVASGNCIRSLASEISLETFIWSNYSDLSRGHPKWWGV